MDDDAPPDPSADELAASLTSRVRDLLADAERSASHIRMDADAEAQERSLEIRYAAERDAERLLRRAEREAADYLEEARRRIDAFAAGRARRISAAADRLLAHAEALADRAQRAGRLHRGIEEVVDALAAAAEAVAAEASRDPIRLPPAGERSAHVTRLTTRPHAAPDPEPLRPVPDPPSDEDEALVHVRESANMLPRRPGAPRPTPPVVVPPPEPPDVVA
ncbi:MAG TPA: hypothetical protein VI318_17470 [Baekduia sp.]